MGYIMNTRKIFSFGLLLTFLLVGLNAGAADWNGRKVVSENNSKFASTVCKKVCPDDQPTCNLDQDGVCTDPSHYDQDGNHIGGISTNTDGPSVPSSVGGSNVGDTSIGISMARIDCAKKGQLYTWDPQAYNFKTKTKGTCVSKFKTISLSPNQSTKDDTDGTFNPNGTETDHQSAVADSSELTPLIPKGPEALKPSPILNDLDGNLLGSGLTKGGLGGGSEPIETLKPKDAQLLAQPLAQPLVQDHATDKSAPSGDLKNDDLSNSDSNNSSPNNSSPNNSDIAAQSVSKTPCEDEALKKIVAELSSEPMVLGVLFDMASLKVAKKVLENNPKHKTFEEYAKQRLGDMQSYVSNFKNTEESQKTLKKLYQEHGLKEDLELLDPLVVRSKNPCYYSCQQRLLNTHSSAYLLLMSQQEKEKSSTYGISEVDVAAVWAVEKIRSTAESQNKNAYKIGSVNGNLMNLSTRVARYLGAIENGEKLSKDEIDLKIAAQSQDLENAVTHAYTDEIKKALEDCLKKANQNCDECATNKMTAFHGGLLKNSVNALLKEVNNAQTVQMSKALKGAAGKVQFDLSKIPVGSVPKWSCPKGVTQVRDACTGKMVKCGGSSSK